MGFITKLLGVERRAITDPQPANFVPAYFSVFGAGFNDTSVPVTEELALTVSAVWSAVSCIADSFASLPAHVLDRQTAEKRTDHPLYAMLHDEPNEFMGAATFRSAVMLNLLLWGNGYAYIVKDDPGRPTALLPLLSRATWPVRQGGMLFYQTMVGNEPATIPADRMFHVMGQTLDGFVGLSPVQYARQTVGLSLALERMAAKFFGAGCNVGGLIEAPPGMSPEAQKDFVAKWRKAYTSIDGMFKIAALPPGIKFHQTTVDPEKAQAVQSRVHQIREVARIFRVPPHKLGDLERATFSNIEHQQVEFQQEGIQPWAIRWEQEANRKLLLEREKPALELRFNLDSLLRADTKTRYEAHAAGLNAGFLTVNEVRAKENLPPVDGGDVLRVPLNMGPAAPAAARALVEDAARRLLTKESKAIVRAIGKHAGRPDEFRAWAAGFYKDHQELAARTLGNADYAQRHCAGQLQAVTDAFTAGKVEDLLDEWDTTRPAEIAERLAAKPQ